MARITGVLAREVLDSRGNPTVECEIVCGDVTGRAIVPSGASTGSAEAHELRDDDPLRYEGRGVRRAVEHIRQTLGPAVVGLEATRQSDVDARLQELDDTPHKSKLGANALLAVSLATAHAAAAAERRPLYLHVNHLYGGAVRMPLPMTNMISGGLHAGGNLDFQDFLISPAGAGSYTSGLEWIVRVYRHLGRLLHEAGYEAHLVGDEGGYGPRLAGNAEALELLTRAIEAADLTPGDEITLALDVAATHFYDGSHYCLSDPLLREPPEETSETRLSSAEMIEAIGRLVDRFAIASVEDALAEDDWDGWRQLTARLGDRVRLVGDDLFATNPSRLRQGIEAGAANAILIKLNQIGTLSETLNTMHIAEDAGFARIVSARSGETEDTTIADLAVGTAAEQIKIGSIVRGERLAKYNRLLRIEEQLADISG